MLTSSEPLFGWRAMDVVADLDGLPLRVERHPGVWHPETTLLMLRWDPEAPVLPAEPPPAPWSDGRYLWAWSSQTQRWERAA